MPTKTWTRGEFTIEAYTIGGEFSCRAILRRNGEIMDCVEARPFIALACIVRSMRQTPGRGTHA